MSERDTHDPDFHDGYVGVSRSELEAMAESELAQWQVNHSNEPPKVILAEREWQRRLLTHQYNLEGRLAKAAEVHSERLSKGNRWWGIAASAIGVIGTLAGVLLGKHLESNSQTTTAQQAQTQRSSPPVLQPLTPSNSATSAGSSTTVQPGKKAP